MVVGLHVETSRRSDMIVPIAWTIIRGIGPEEGNQNDIPLGVIIRMENIACFS